MIDERDLFVRAAERFDPPTDAYLRFQRREDRRRKRQRVGAAVIAVSVVLLLIGGFALAWSSAQRQTPVSTPEPTRTVPTPSPAGGGWGEVALPAVHQPSPSPGGGGPRSGGVGSPSIQRSVVDLAASSSGFVAVGSESDGRCPIWFSAEGRSWTQVPGGCPDVVGLADVIAGGPGFIAVGTATGNEPAVWFSTDGSSWQRASVPLPTVRMQDPDHMWGIVATTSGFLAWGWVGNLDVYLWTSVDGKTWQPVQDESGFGGPGEPFVLSITQGPAGLVANGYVRPDGSVNNGTATVWTSPDGSSWVRDTPRGVNWSTWAWMRLLATGSNYLGLAPNPNGYQRDAWLSTDGVSWTRGVLPTDLSGAAIAALRGDDHGGFIAIGHEDGEHTIWTSPDGASWTAYPGLPGASYSTLVAAGPRGIVVGPIQASGTKGLWFHPASKN